MIFDPGFQVKFQLFTQSHIVTMFLIAALWVMIPVVFNHRKDTTADRIFRWTLAILLVVQYLGWMIWEAATGRFTIQTSLPINLCDISNFICAALLITKNYPLYEILYFWALAGTIQSYITPNIYYSFPHFEFFAFYIQHGGEILTILYLTFVTGFRPRVISGLKAIGWLLGLIAAIYLFNYATGSNYMFLMADTPHPSTVTKMISIFGEPPRHIIGLGIVAILSVLFLYLPFAIRDRAKKYISSKR
ncbi:MAG: TIGR02206 family membrane protein [Chitinivibrionales bacterium]|nr:TIGR02206 family membrane protein [Chitinivibrionales bacterium]